MRFRWAVEVGTMGFRQRFRNKNSILPYFVRVNPHCAMPSVAFHRAKMDTSSVRLYPKSLLGAFRMP